MTINIVMNIIANLYFGFFIIYYIIFFIVLLYTIIVEEWCCTNRIPIWYSKALLCISRKYYILPNENDNENENDIV
jgi:hypothetical protein